MLHLGILRKTDFETVVGIVAELEMAPLDQMDPDIYESANLRLGDRTGAELIPTETPSPFSPEVARCAQFSVPEIRRMGVNTPRFTP